MRPVETLCTASDSERKILEFLQGVAQARARALMLDYDGTLAPFRVDRACAVPYPEIVPLLQRLKQETDTRLVIVTGRPALDASRLLGSPGLEIWGCHGLERLKVDGTIERPEFPEESRAALAEATDLLIGEGLEPYAERKITSIAIHWRGRESLADDLAHRVKRVWSVVQHRKGLRLLPFNGGLEITMDVRNKGDAVRTLLSEMGAEAAVAYLGDDTTDEAAFEALKGHGLSVLVREDFCETLADVWIQPPNGVAAFLRAWTAACRASE